MKDDETAIEGTEVDADEEAEQGLDTELDAEEEIDAPRRTKFGRSFALGAFILSILLGGTLGVIGSKIFAGPDKTIALRAEFQQSLDDIRQTTQAQTKQLGVANDTVSNRAMTRIDTLQMEISTLINKVDAQEQAIAQLKLAAETSAKTFTDRIAVLEALSGENTEVFSGADSITSRLEALEKHTLEQDIANEVSTKLPEETLNVKRISVKPPADPTRQAALDVLIDTFPRAKLLSAVKAQEQAASKKPGWLKRALSKHIRMGNDNAPDPYDVINAAEKALQSGQVTGAIEKLAQLNTPVRTSAAAWVEAAKKAAPLIENTISRNPLWHAV